MEIAMIFLSLSVVILGFATIMTNLTVGGLISQVNAMEERLRQP